jgi:hypothetical protein
MDSEIKVISKNAIPRTNFRVRRRRYNDITWLVQHNEWVALDDLSDLVWRACEASLTVEQIALSLAAEGNIPLRDALAATVYALGEFHQMGFVSLMEAQMEDAIPNGEKGDKTFDGL